MTVLTPVRQRTLLFVRLRSFAGWLFPAALSAFVIARTTFIAGQRLMWTDELLSWYPLSGSFGSMLRATADTINTAPPFYFVVGWIWVAIFGNSAVSVRLFSAIAIAAAIMIMFAVLRRSYGALAAGLALAVVLTDPFLLVQSAQARFHALFVAEVALAILLYQRLATHPRPPRRLLILNGIVHGSMMMTTYVAPLYSLALLAAMLLVSWMRGYDPKPACLSIAAGWLVFLPWLPVFSRHLRMGEPSSWVNVPEPSELWRYFEGYLTYEFWIGTVVFAGLAGLSSVLALIYGGRWRRLGPRRREKPLLILALLLAAVPFVLYLWSRQRGHASIFLERYMLPTLLGWAILLAHLAHRALLPRHDPRRRWLTRGLVYLQAIAATAFIGHGVWKGTHDFLFVTKQEQPPEILARIPAHHPLVVEHIHDFLQWHFYSPQRSRYLFIIDVKAGIQEGGGGPLNHRIMAALKRRFPDQFAEAIPTGEFLATASDFSVRPSSGCQWLPLRLEHNPNFVIERMSDDLWHVRRAP